MRIYGVIVSLQGGYRLPIVDASEGQLSKLLGGNYFMFADTAVSPVLLRTRGWDRTNDPVTCSQFAT